MGLTTFAVLSDGSKFTAPKPLKANLARLRRANKALSRKKKGSANRAKAKLRLALLHYRIACKRNDFLHKLSTSLVRKHETIVIEDLNVEGMKKRFGKSLSDISFAEFRRQLEYKAPMNGSHIVVADRWFPSTKLCSECGEKNLKLTLKDRNWTCTCGASHDRDLNAAKNLLALATP